MSSSERPEWCRNINCPNYPGYGDCCLKRGTLDGWKSLKGRQREFERLESLASEDPQAVIDLCARKQ